MVITIPLQDRLTAFHAELSHDFEALRQGASYLNHYDVHDLENKALELEARMNQFRLEPIDPERRSACSTLFDKIQDVFRNFKARIENIKGRVLREIAPLARTRRDLYKANIALASLSLMRDQYGKGPLKRENLETIYIYDAHASLSFAESPIDEHLTAVLKAAVEQAEIFTSKI